MAHLRSDFFLEALDLSTSMTVILPQATSTQIGMTGRAGTELPPVLYLLHGLSDDDTSGCVATRSSDTSHRRGWRW